MEGLILFVQYQCNRSFAYFQAPHSYGVWGFSNWSISESHPILIGCDKSCDIRIIDDIGANVVRAHERFPCGGRRSGH